MKWFAKRFLDKAQGLLVCLMALALIDGQVVGQCVEHKILAADGTQHDLFGKSVCINGNVAIVGANQDSPNGRDHGSAYIYRKSSVNWIQETKLTASDGGEFDWFGWSVSIIGDVAIVGAPFNDINSRPSGSAYIFRSNGTTWVEETKLIPTDIEQNDQFGRSVSISGAPGNEVVIVGANGVDDNGSSSGAAYIFRFNPETSEWIEEAKLIASDGAEFDQFGFSVSISITAGNEVAIVAATFDDDNGTSSGSAYIFRYDPGLPGWTEEAKLLASDGAEFDQFGRSVSISGDPGNEVAIIGAPYDDDNGSDSGSAYIYRKSGANWVEVGKLLATNGEPNNWLGESVSISGTLGNELAIVGAQHTSGSIGTAYFYRFNHDTSRWLEETILLASDGAGADFFGSSVSISGTPGNEVAIVGAWSDNDNGINSGSAYIYELPCPLSCPADTDDSGNVSVADLLLLLGAWGPNPGHAADFNSDGAVNVTDLLALLAAWGPCP